MFEMTQVHLSPTTRAAVVRFLQAQGDERSVAAVVEQAVQAWLQQIARADPQAAQAAARGYQWKSLFLPEGTCVRFDYRRQTHHAEVRGDRIVYQGEAYSPRQLLLHLTGTVRNAWRELWLRSPGDFRWHLADTRRHILRRTPRGRHRRGIDATGLRAAAVIALAQRVAAQAAGLPAPPRDPFPVSSGTDAVLRARLYRDDLVREDQPDLTSKHGGGGRVRAGRAGPRDRRYCHHIAAAMAARVAVAAASP
jgi:hypothetical protein